MDSKLKFRLTKESLLIPILVGLKLILNLALDQNYGYFRDEFLYIALSKRLFAGPMDMPLLAPTLMAITRGVFGESLLALHIFPAIAGALVIVFTVRMVREFGGKFYAQLLAGVCVLLAPLNLGLNSSFSYDSFDQLFWVLCIYMLVKIFKHDSSKTWLLFGLFAGLGLLTKQGMLFLGFAVAVALLITSQRAHFRQRWIWLAGFIAFLFFIPYVLVQMQLDWPSLGYWKYYTDSKTYPVSPLEFIFLPDFRDESAGVSLFGRADWAFFSSENNTNPSDHWPGFTSYYYSFSLDYEPNSIFCPRFIRYFLRPEQPSLKI